ncbi:hypothetical protein [Actinophytocola glycyrrhizae]|uniref:Translation initiation factor IF-2 n=1 Tax=Actinophytocola glycyrrhizae TaxID=2044873 RepID=A0ABV9RVE0_9PSEU
MSLLEVDPDAPRRVEGITAAGLRALGEVRQRSEDVDKATDEMFERRERARQELDEQVRQAAAQGEKPEEKADKPKPKRTLALGGEEFHREGRQAEAPTPAAPPPPAPEPEKKDEPARPGKTLKLGARDEADEPSPEPRPVRRPRPQRPAGDDDLSGRTWLR